MDLTAKSAGDLFVLSHHVNSLLDELPVAGNEDLHDELTDLNDSIDHELSSRPALRM